jgi:lipoprotein-anchoring transpeptidase ErfK/SrfK
VAKKRIHEIAKDQGLTSKEVIERLAQSGIEGKVAVSTIEEDVALEVLGNGRLSGSARAPWEGEPDGPGRASSNGAAAAREQGGPLFWLKTVSLVLLKGDAEAPTAPGARAGYRAPARSSTSPHAPEAPPRQLPPASHLRAGAVALLAAAGIVALAAWLFGAFDSGTTKERQQTPTVARTLTPLQRQDAALARFRSVVAGVSSRKVPIYRSPRRLRPFTHLSNPNADGAPLVFLVIKRTPRWLQVHLPMRPNGSTGWIRRERVTLAGHNYRMKINLGRHRLTAWNGPSVIANVRIGVGKAVTPTPPGLYYITELLQQPEPDGPYGPFAFGISAYSNVLHEFAGADGILGIHGTNDPAAIGTDVSHGCIRMTNENISRLAHILPAGTPVRIVD